MFDPRTDLPVGTNDINFNEMSYKQLMDKLSADYKQLRTPGTPENIAFERKQIDELAEFIEANLLDELADQGCVEGFRLNAIAGLRRDFKGLEQYNNGVRHAACSQVWYKYNH